MTTWYSDLDSAKLEEIKTKTKTKITNSVILFQL